MEKDARELPKLEKNSKKLMKIYSKCKPRLHWKRKKRNWEFKRENKRKKLLSIYKKLKRRRDLNISRLLSNNWLIDKLLNLWKFEIRRKKFLTSKLLRLKIKQLNCLKKKKEEDLKWKMLLKEAERIKLTEFKERKIIRKKKNSNSLNFGNWEMKNWLLLSNKSVRKRDKEELSWQTIWKNKLKKRMSKHRKNLLQSNTLHLLIKLFKINKRRTSTHMLRNVFLNGEIKVRMSNL